MKLSLIIASLFLTSTAFAGHQGGPRHITTTLEAGHADYYDFIPVPQADFEIQVKGSGNSDLDCFLYDGVGRLVAKDDDTTDTCLIGGKAISPAYRLFVRNVGSDLAIYQLATN